MNQRSMTIIGRIHVNEESLAPSEISVEAWLLGQNDGAPVATTTVDKYGHFTFNLDRDQESIGRAPSEAVDALYFRVFAEGREVANTRRTHLWYLGQENGPLIIEVALPAAPRPAPGGGTPDEGPAPDSGGATDNGGTPDGPPTPVQTVTGRIMTPEGAAAPNVAVRLFQRTIKGETPLDNGKVGDDGRYRFDIKPSEGPRDFVVKVIRNKKVIAASEPCVETTQTVQIDVIVGDEPFRGPAEYDRLLDALAPYLEGADLAGIDEAGLEFLECKSGFSLPNIGRAARAAALAPEVGLEPAILYGIFRSGIPHQRRRLLRQRPAAIQAAARSAVKRHLISRAHADSAQKAADVFADYVGRALLDPEQAPDKGRAKRLLDLAGLSDGQQQRLVKRRLAHVGSTAGFWEILKQDGQIGEEAVVRLQRANQLDRLTGAFAPLTEALHNAAEKGEFETLQDLAGWSLYDWIDRLKQSGVPKGAPGRNVNSQRFNYSRTIMNALAGAYPTTALGADLATRGFSQAAAMGDFIAKHPDFEFRTQRLADYLAENPAAKPAPETEKALQAVERLMKITPDANKAYYVGALLNDGLDSACRIQQVGRAEFLRRYVDPDEPESQAKVEAIYRAASYSAGMAQQLFMSYGPPAQNTKTAIMANQATLFQQAAPQWQNLFGAVDACSCEHCQSVYSPAAYLVDMLQFLHDRGALDELYAKRPDIGAIKLDCDNANTPLPYIDLVLEILEQAVVTGGDLKPTDDGAWPRQTTLDADVLRIQPEHLQRAAYDILRTQDAVYPFDLPFDLWQVEADAYLGHLQADRATIMARFSRTPADRALEIAAAQLGISTPVDLTFITDARAQFKLAWGYPANANERQMYRELANVDFFLGKTGLTYDEMTELLALSVINVNGNLALELAGDEPCDLTRATIQNLGRRNLNLIHSFLRLRQRLSWTIPELGAAIAVLNGGAINPLLIVKLAQFETIRRRLGHPILKLLACWGPIDTAQYGGAPSLYDRLFLNRSVASDAGLETIFGLNPTRDELASPSARLTDHSAHVTAALGLDETELANLTATLDLEDRLTLANLSALYRHTLLADGLDLSMDDYLVYLTLCGPDIFSPQKLEQMLRFFDRVDLLAADGMPVGQVDYLLHHADPDGAFAPAADEIGAVLTAMRTELARLFGPAAEDTQSGDAAGATPDAVIAQQLATALNLPHATMTMLLDEPAVNPESTREGLGAAFLTLIPAEAANTTGDPSPITATTHPLLFARYRLLHKLAAVLVHFDFADPDALAWLLRYGEDLGWLNLGHPDLLPLEPTAPKAATLARWFATAEMKALEARLPAGLPTLRTLIDHINNGRLDDFRTDLLARTGWPADQYDSLLQFLGFSPRDVFGEDRAVMSISRLADCFALSDQLGVTVQTLWSWSNTAPSFEQALAIKQAVRAKYEETEWQAIARTLRDGLRERQRAALVSHLIQQTPGVETEADLFGRLLIDVEMSACMETSRIKQALSSVQIFVQRCFLNLEPGVRFDAGDAEQWQWMKRYRVWEANRKIFLYPENWIEPELRDDKTPIFEEIESFLLQDEVTPERAEEALRRYLERLDQIAAVDVAGLYHELDEGTNVLHIIGRTPAVPHVYFYRKLIDETRWTPWEEVEVEIEGEHVLPVVFNRRLYLFWLTIADKDPREVKLAWSQFWNGKWSPKSLSSFHFPLSVPSNNRGNWRQRLRLQSTVAANSLAIDLFYIISTYGGDYEHVGQFLFNGCTMDPTPGLSREEGALALPNGTFFDHQHFTGFPHASYSPTRHLEVPVGADSRENASVAGVATHIPLLRNLDERYVVQPANQFSHFLCQAPYAYQDSRHRFLALPSPGIVSYVEPYTPPNVDTPVPMPTPPSPPVPPFPPGGVIPIEPPGGLRPDFDIVEWPIDDDDLFSDFEWLMGEPTISMGGLGGLRQMTPAGALLQATVSLPATINGRYTVQPLANQTLPAAAGSLVELAGSDSERVVTRYVLGRYHRFITFYHPYSCLFQRELARLGVDGVLDPPVANPAAGPIGEGERLRRQRISLGDDHFAAVYNPDPDNVLEPYPKFEIAFDQTDAYAQYNWEIFFHLPFLIANHLNQNQQFEAAQRWYHYIFDPTDTDTERIAAGSGSNTRLDPARFWKIRPFYENDAGLTIQRMLRLLAGPGDPADGALADEIGAQIDAWRRDPFDPHAIARFRTTAYQKSIVAKYIDNLIDWGDALFAQDTIESINEATQLYLLAQEILGERPRDVPVKKSERRTIDGRTVETYNDLRVYLDEFSNALVEVENLVGYSYPGGNGPLAPPALGSALFFCIPGNDQMLGYWDTVAERLFKIRNCMNIEGVVRSLALYEPPIDPALLVRAAAAGVDLGSVLADQHLGLPHYRFNYLVQRAAQFAGDVQSLGNALLAALEKQDAEELALLRAGHESRILKLVKAVKSQQVAEAQAALEALTSSQAMAEYRRDYYQNIERRIAGERQQLQSIERSKNPQRNAVISQSIGSVAALTPNLKVGMGVETIWGGSQLAGFAAAIGAWFQFKGTVMNIDANLAGLNAGFRRRADEWRLQETLAAMEAEQLDKQIAAAEIRLAMAEQDLTNHEEQIAQAEAVESVMREKFTNRALYSWMVTRISAVYFQAYQLAYDLAKKAQAAFRHELADDAATFISFGYWDSLRKGLLAGDLLLHDLRRMEQAYLDGHKRELELTKHISLAQVAPEALLQLRKDGNCIVDLPEGIFDLDYPGHYCRRIKTVRLTIPALSGPYTNINCTLTLNSHRTRRATTLRNAGSPEQYPTGYAWDGDYEDERFKYGLDSQSIATSTGVNDGGLFEINFRDERYLPFEGAGVISNWTLDLGSPDFAQFDFDSIGDVVFHISYTARPSDLLRTAVETELAHAINAMLDATGELGQLFSLRSRFPDAWARLLAADGSADYALALDLRSDHFPHLAARRGVTITGVELWQADALLVDGAWSDAESNDFLGEATFDLPGTVVAQLGGEVKDLVLLCRYTV